MEREIKFRANGLRKQIRRAIADYIGSEGCSCCQSVEQHKKHEEQLAKLLLVKKYPDGSGYDFAHYRTKKKLSDT